MKKQGNVADTPGNSICKLCPMSRGYILFWQFTGPEKQTKMRSDVPRIPTGRNACEGWRKKGAFRLQVPADLRSMMYGEPWRIWVGKIPNCSRGSKQVLATPAQSVSEGWPVEVASIGRSSALVPILHMLHYWSKGRGSVGSVWTKTPEDAALKHKIFHVLIIHPFLASPPSASSFCFILLFDLPGSFRPSHQHLAILFSSLLRATLTSGSSWPSEDAPGC